MNEQGFRGTFTVPQTKQLLAAIKPQRVLQDARNNSHVSQQDVVAHLIRVFGFGNFATEILGYEMIFETPHIPEKAGDPKARWTVAYRASLRLTIFDRNHNMVTYFEDASVGDAQNQVREQAHDLALKSAISLAKKRCAINLGDQFGLSLYNKGQMAALVMGTHVLPDGYDKPEADGKPDLQDGVPQQESMGVDEIEKKAEATDEQEQIIRDSLGGVEVPDETAK